jgi:HSP20 family protein
MAQLPARRSGHDVTTADPFREFEDIYDRMGQLVNAAFLGAPSYMRVIDAPWTPLADISETDDAYVIEAELPGVTKDNLNVELNDRELVISGEIPMQEEKEKEKEKRLRRRRTRRTGRFELRTLLPGDVNPDAVTANLSDGVLTVRVPKAQAAKPRRVEITG